MRPIRTLLTAGLLGFALIGATTGGALAYGKADGPIAQLELSGNCDNPGFVFCAPPEQGGVGLGGIWLWIEIDGGAGATSGPADVAGSLCEHVPGVGGGAIPVNGEFQWKWSSAKEGPLGEDVSFGSYDGADGWYNVTISSLGGMTWSFPVTTGHYSSHPDTAVAIEVQVAPSGPTG